MMTLLNLDPTRTTMLRRRLNSALVARFNMFKKDLRKLLIEDDAFGLSNRPTVIFNWSDKARRKSLETRRRNALIKHSKFKQRDGERHDIHANGKNIGFAFIKPSKGEVFLDDLRVIPKEQGKGFGNLLMKRVVSKYGHKRITLKASPHYDKRLDQKALIKFYSKFGFSVKDSEGRMERKPTPTHNSSIVLNDNWRYLPEERRLQELKKWLRFKTGQLFLKHENDDSARSWLGSYINQVYQRGLKRAWDDWKRPTQSLMMSKEQAGIFERGRMSEFMRQSFGGPTPVERVQVLATRAFNDLEGVTDSMSKQITRTLIDGMANGLNPREVGVELNKLVDGHKRRGSAIARTEMIRGFNEGALDGLDNLGATSVGIMVEWSVSGLGMTKKGNPSPCEKCAPLANLVLKIEEARGLLPRHPNCMCSFIPANVGEKTSSQIRDAKRIRAAIKRSARGDTRWLGARKKISARRPKVEQ